MAARCFLVTASLLLCGGLAVCQQTGAEAGAGVNLVQPGAPGQPSTTLTAITAVTAARPPSEADIRFMQDMIMHHGQAVEMTELLKTRSKDPEVQELGRKIDVSQSDEISWMKQWLADRGIPLETMGAMPGMHPASTPRGGEVPVEVADRSAMAGMAGMDSSRMSGMDHGTHGMAAGDASSPSGHAAEVSASGRKPADGADPMDMAMMPGMLTPRQMGALQAAGGNQFDVLFLTGMMQHHSGALLMVKQLFASPGAGQDGPLFDFANDVDNTQQAEIDIMKGILRRVKP